MFRWLFAISALFVLQCLGLSPPVAPLVPLNDGHKMPALALGTWLGYSSEDRVVPKEDEVESAVKWAVEAGYRHIDTAAIYETEAQVGRAVNQLISEGKVKRNDLFITTKLWNDRHARDAVIPALKESLKRLNQTYVDLYLIHWPIGQFENKTYDVTDYVETWKGMMDAKKEGLTRSIGVSNFNVDQMNRLLENGLETPAALQVEMNLNLQQPNLLSYCKDKKIVVMGYTPFGSLFPSKAKADAPPPRVDDEKMKAIAAKYNKTVPQIALRYLVELNVVPLPKSLSKSRIEENIQVFDMSLSPEEKSVLKSFDNGYRTLPQTKWLDNPFYPFEKAELEVVPLPKSLTQSRIEDNIQIFDFTLSPEDKTALKSFDKGYRSILPSFWSDHPYYPFEKEEKKP